MYGTRAMTDDITRAFDTEARAICTKATNFLEEQPEEVMDDYEEEMDTSITPFGECTSSVIPMTIEGSAHDANFPDVPQIPDDKSFELVPSSALLKE
ncbi:hypothetical protein MRB53_006164 [Persea americana]|uniref:Uncharacterized protein n=1 Tax=Persea americana TaxID=3435 RepID=A0ACC2MFM2_PERAE|nr:hypothetical protein MRB53_006164 [Persea americana]